MQFQRLTLVAGLVGVLLLALAYSNTYDNAFHFDDEHVIVNNLYIRNLGNIPRFFTDAHTFSAQPTNATYRPLLTLTYAMDYALAGGLEPSQFHRTQLLLLLLLAVSLFFFFLRIANRTRPAPENPFIALFAASLFSLHPTNTETFNLISSRSDLISTLFVVLALLAYMRGGVARRFHLYLILIVLGGLAKATVIVFAPVLLVYRLLFERDRNEGIWVAVRGTIPAFVVSGALLVFLHFMNAPEWSSGGGDRVDYLRTQMWVWVRYFRLFFVPVGLSADSDLRVIARWSDPRVIAGILFVAALAVAIWKSSRNAAMRPVTLGLAWFALSLLPTSSIFPLGEMMNEHRIFMPYIGLALATTWLLALLLGFPRRRAALAGAAGGLILIALAIGTYQRNEVWRTAESLWLDVTRKSPRNGRAFMSYGLARMAAGDNTTAQRYFEQALRILPSYVPLHINLAIARDRLGDSAGAEAHFRRALSIEPNDSHSHYFYGRWLSSKGRGPEAIPHLEHSAVLSPAFELPRVLLLGLYAASGSQEKLRAMIAEVQRISPSEPTAALLQNVLLSDPPQDPSAMLQIALGAVSAGDPIRAAVASRAALRGDPRSAEAQRTLQWAMKTLGFSDKR